MKVAFTSLGVRTEFSGTSEALTTLAQLIIFYGKANLTIVLPENQDQSEKIGAEGIGELTITRISRKEERYFGVVQV